jgi:hypothetical protein
VRERLFKPQADWFHVDSWTIAALTTLVMYDRRSPARRNIACAALSGMKKAALLDVFRDAWPRIKDNLLAEAQAPPPAPAAVPEYEVAAVAPRSMRDTLLDDD